jgi:CubicO group peptidase (beta-lactamase class C family)
MLKFGLLYVNKGQWNGVSIIDSNWVKQSFIAYINRPHLKIKIRDGGYGYQFWTYNDTVKTKPFDIIEAKGNGGQSVFICKQLHLLVVTTAGNYNKPGDNPYMMLTKYILPSIK